MKRSLVFLFCIAMLSCAGVSMYAKIDSTIDLSRFVGGRVEVTGRISSTPWQHMMAPSAAFPHDYYFDKGPDQIVIYSKTPIACAGILTVRGTVVKIQGDSKRPDTKADETFVEYHIQVDEWECR